jgi:hypothetical protein
LASIRVMAAIPGSNGIISSCYSKSTGAMKVIDSEAGDTCNAQQNALNWSASGNGAQSAYAFFNDDGSLDSSRSHGISSVKPLLDGSGNILNECLEVGFNPKFGLASMQDIFNAPQNVEVGGGPQQLGPITAACGAGYNAYAPAAQNSGVPMSHIEYAFYN